MARKPGRSTRENKAGGSGGQVENLRDSLLPPPEGAIDPNAPRCPFKTAYKLTRQQEDDLCEFANKRLDQLCDQLGRTGDEGTSGGRSQSRKSAQIQNPDSFFGKRKKFSRSYYGHNDWRKKPNTIFEQSNLTASLSQRITMQMIARASNFFFGQPDDIDWFSTQAVGAEDENQSDKIKKHSRWKIDQCGVKTRFNEGLEYAFIRGEAVIKPTHQTRSQIYKRTATILMGGLNEETQEPDPELPLLDAHGDYIVQGDAFVPEMAEAPPPPVEPPGILQRVKQALTGPEQNGSEPQQEPQMQATGNQVLKRDGATVLPAEPVWNTQEITRQLITFEGPETPVVYFEDFICPESATDVQSSDLIAHLYDMDIMRVVQMFRGQFGEGDQAIANMQAAVERIREMTGESNLPKAAAKQPRGDFKESDTTGASAVPICQIAEIYLTYDADGDGIQEEIMLVLDRAHKAPIFYEYTANVTARGLRPFFVWRPMPVDQRWYGMGSMELFDSEQEFLDLLINRYNYAMSKSGRVTLWRPQNTLEGARDQNLKLNDGGTYTPVAGKKDEEVLSYVALPFEEKHLDYLINLYMQFMQTKSGVLNSADQEMSGLPSNELATGINEIKDSGEELFSRMLSHLFPGVKETLKAVIDIIYANLNRSEVFAFFNGDATEIIELSPEDVRDLALNVTLELSRSQQRKAIETGQLAQALITWYYQMTPELQTRLAGYARKQLKALGVGQADQIIEPMQPQNNAGPIDKPSAVGNMLAALIKTGVEITFDDINGLLQQCGLQPLASRGPSPAAPPPAPPKLPGEDNGSKIEGSAEPPQSAI